MVKKELILKIISFIITFSLFVNSVYADGVMFSYKVEPISGRIGAINLQNIGGNIYQYAVIDYRDGKQYTIIGFVIPIAAVNNYSSIGNPFPDLEPNPLNFIENVSNKSYLWIIPICGRNIKIDAVSVFPPPKILELREKTKQKFTNILLNKLPYYYFPFISFLPTRLFKLVEVEETSKGYEVLQRIEKYGLEIELIDVTDKEKFSEFLSNYNFPQGFPEEIKNYNCNFVIAKFNWEDVPAYTVPISPSPVEVIRKVNFSEILIKYYVLKIHYSISDFNYPYYFVHHDEYPIIYLTPGIYIEFETDKPWYPTKLTKLMGIDEIKVYTNNLVPENVDYRFIDFTDFRYGNVSANALLSVKTGEDIVFKKYDFSSKMKIYESLNSYAFTSYVILYEIVLNIALIIGIILHNVKRRIIPKFGLLVTFLVAPALILLVMMKMLDLLFNLLFIRGGIISTLFRFMFSIFPYALAALDIGLKIAAVYCMIKDFRAKIDIPIIILLLLPLVFYYIIMYLII